MLKNDVRLEKTFVKYRDLINIPTRENKDKMVYLDQIRGKYLKNRSEMKRLTDGKILVRQEVLKRLKMAQELLSKQDEDLDLVLTYGFRDLSIQTERFLKRLKEVSNEYFEDPTKLYETIHRSVAVPSVAGHPTGGAVDIIIVNKKTNKPLDFGSKQYDYSNKNSYVFINGISAKARKNRNMLRSCMLQAGFAPFDAEWWHFSYGDKEWAFYYKKPYALYKQLTLKEIKV